MLIKLILNNDIIFDIDWQGTKQLSKFKNLKLIKIYLITDNKEELKKIDQKKPKYSEEILEDLKHLMKILNTGMTMIIL